MPPKKGFSDLEGGRWRPNCASASKQLSRQNITVSTFMCVFFLLVKTDPLPFQATKPMPSGCQPNGPSPWLAKRRPRWECGRPWRSMHDRHYGPHHGERNITLRLPEHYNMGPAKQFVARHEL